MSIGAAFASPTAIVGSPTYRVSVADSKNDSINSILPPQPAQPNFLAALGGLKAIEESCEVNARHSSIYLSEDFNPFQAPTVPTKAASSTFQTILYQIQDLENTEAIRRADQRLQAMQPARQALRKELAEHNAILDAVQRDKVQKVMDSRLLYETSVLRKLAPSDQSHNLCFQPSEFCENAAARSLQSPQAIALAEEARLQREKKEAEEWVKHPQRMKEPGELARKFGEKLEKALKEEKHEARERALKRIRAVEQQQGSPTRIPRKLPSLNPTTSHTKTQNPTSSVTPQAQPVISPNEVSPSCTVAAIHRPSQALQDPSPSAASRRLSTSLLNASATGRRLDGAKASAQNIGARSLNTSSKGDRRLSIQSHDGGPGSGTDAANSGTDQCNDMNVSSSDESMNPFHFEGEDDDVDIHGKTEAEKIEDEWFKGLRRTASLKGFSRPGSGARPTTTGGDSRPTTGSRGPLLNNLSFHHSNFGLRSIRLRVDDLKAEIESLANQPQHQNERDQRTPSYGYRSFGAPPSPFLEMTSKGLADQLPSSPIANGSLHEAKSSTTFFKDDGDARPTSAESRSLRDVKRDAVAANNALNSHKAARQRPNTSGPVMQSRFRRNNAPAADSIYTRRPASAMELVRHYRQRLDELSTAPATSTRSDSDQRPCDNNKESSEPLKTPPTSPPASNITQLADLNREVSLFDRAARLNHIAAGLEDNWWKFHKQLDVMAAQHPLPLEAQPEDTRETRAAATKDRVDYVTIRSYARAHTPHIQIRTPDQLATMPPIEEPQSLQEHKERERLKSRRFAKKKGSKRDDEGEDKTEGLGTGNNVGQAEVEDANEEYISEPESEAQVDMRTLIDQILFGDIPAVDELGKLPVEARVATLTPSRERRNHLDETSPPRAETARSPSSTSTSPQRSRPQTQHASLSELQNMFESSSPPPKVGELMPMVEGTGATLTAKAVRLLKNLDMRNRCARTLQRFARKYILEPLREEERVANLALQAAYEGTQYETILEHDLGMSGTEDIFGVKLKAPRRVLSPSAASSTIGGTSPRQLSVSSPAMSYANHSLGRPPLASSGLPNSKPPLSHPAQPLRSSSTFSPTLAMVKRSTGPHKDDAEEAAIQGDDTYDLESYQTLAEESGDPTANAYFMRIGTTGSPRTSSRGGNLSRSAHYSNDGSRRGGSASLRNHEFALDGQNFENVLDAQDTRIGSSSMMGRVGPINGAIFSDIHGKEATSEDETSHKRPNTAEYSPRATAERSSLATAGSKRPSSGARLKWA